MDMLNRSLHIYNFSGIIGNKGCDFISAWQAFDCHGEGTLNYEMLVVESLDEDTETRRLSPVALHGDDYIDLNNGMKTL